MQKALPFPRHLSSRGGLGTVSPLGSNVPLITPSRSGRGSIALPGSAPGDTSPGASSAGLSFATNNRDVLGQVVHAAWSTPTNFSTAGWSNTGLTLTMTPRYVTSSVMLILSMNGGHKVSSNVIGAFRITRNAGANIVGSSWLGWPFLHTNAVDSMGAGTAGAVVIDTPATTSPITYQVQIYLSAALTMTMNLSFGNPSTSTLTAIEMLGG